MYVSLIYNLCDTFSFRSPHLWREKKERKRKQARGKGRLVRVKLAKRRGVRVKEREARRKEKLARRREKLARRREKLARRMRV